MLESNSKRAAVNDPNRCQMVIPSFGQCTLLAEENSPYCRNHSGSRMKSLEEKKNIRKYRLAKIYSRVEDLAMSPKLKDLSEELALLQLLFEEKLNSCQDMNDVLLNQTSISNLATQIKDMTLAAQKLDSQMGLHLNKSAILQFASYVIEVIAEEDLEPEVLERVSNKMINKISTLKDEAN